MNLPMSLSTKQLLIEVSEDTNAKMYKSLIGKLLYITHTRDVVYEVNLLFKFMTKPTNIHFGAAMNILRYLAGTSDFGIQYSRNVEIV